MSHINVFDRKHGDLDAQWGMLGLGDGTDGDVVAQYGDVQWSIVWGCSLIEFKIPKRSWFAFFILLCCLLNL